MTKHQITIEIDEASLRGYSDEWLATVWHVAQANPAPHGDHAAGELAEYIGREIIRRWLGGVEPELWRHQGRDYYWRALGQIATYTPGGESGTPEWHNGTWAPKGDDDAAGGAR